MFAITMDDDGNLTDNIIDDINTTIIPMNNSITDDIIYLSDPSMFAMTEDESRIYGAFNTDNVIEHGYITSEKELTSIIASLDKHLLEDNVDFDASTKMANDNYFVIAIPKEDVYSYDMHRTFEFI